MFLKDGVIVSTKGRSHPEEVARAEEPGHAPGFPDRGAGQRTVRVRFRGSRRCTRRERPGRLSSEPAPLERDSCRPCGRCPNSGGAQLKITEQAYYLPSGRSAAPQGRLGRVGRRSDRRLLPADHRRGGVRDLHCPAASKTSSAPARARVRIRVVRSPTRSSRSSRIVRLPRRCASDAGKDRYRGVGSRPVGRCRVVAQQSGRRAGAPAFARASASSASSSVWTNASSRSRPPAAKSPNLRTSGDDEIDPTGGQRRGATTRTASPSPSSRSQGPTWSERSNWRMSRSHRPCQRREPVPMHRTSPNPSRTNDPC
jgi:hypothetical protein